MKKKILIIGVIAILIVMLIAMLCILTGCGENAEMQSTGNQEQEETNSSNQNNQPKENSNNENTKTTNNDEEESSTQKLRYGDVVTNYTAQGLEWKVFYQDGDDIFLITSDCVPVEKLPTTALLTTANAYNAYWNSSTLKFQTNSKALSLSDTLKLFKGTEYDISSNKENDSSKAVSTLLNTSNWTDFVDSDYADYAIGGSTIEMWVESWNDTYPSDSLWYSGIGNTGYYFGTGKTSNKSSYYAKLNLYEGYQNTLYFPHKASYSAIDGVTVEDGDINCYGYRLASPSSDGDTTNTVSIGYSGGFGSNRVTYKNLGFRPIAHLKAEVEIQDNGTSYTLK